MAPFLNISWIFWSTNLVSSFYIIIGLGVFACFGWEMKGMVYPCTISNINGALFSFLQFQLISVFPLLAGCGFLQVTGLPQVDECGWTLLVVGVLECWVMVSVGISLPLRGQHILMRNYNYNHYMWKRQIIMIIVIISRWYCYLFWRKIRSRG